MTSLFRLHLSLKPQKSLCLSRWLVSTPYHYTVHGIPLSCRAISDLCLLSCSVVLSVLLFLLRLLISICIYFLCMHKISLRSSQPAPYIIQIMIQFLTLVQILEYTINMQVCCELFFFFSEFGWFISICICLLLSLTLLTQALDVSQPQETFWRSQGCVEVQYEGNSSFD